MAERPPIRVLVADDHQVVRVGLRAIIDAEPDMEVVAEAADAAGAIASFRAHRPDVALLDLRMPGMSGPHMIAEIRRLESTARIVVITTYDADEDVFRAVQAGARGFLLKDTFTEGILEAIRAVHAGRRLIDPQVAARLMDRISEPSLTAREISVLQLVARGMTNKEIGIAGSMSEETVKAHLKHVFAKLDVTDRTEAALLAVQRGLIRL
jgi:two-component system NarL family response regulator